MKKFRKKPVVVEAMQWSGAVTDAKRVIDWVVSQGGTARTAVYHAGEAAGAYCQHGLDHNHLAIETLEGSMAATIGDWVIKGVKGEFYPCKPDIFEATYEAVDES